MLCLQSIANALEILGPDAVLVVLISVIKNKSISCAVATT